MIQGPLLMVPEKFQTLAVDHSLWTQLFHFLAMTTISLEDQRLYGVYPKTNGKENCQSAFHRVSIVRIVNFSGS